jgi:hypothetical protein
LSQTPRDRGRAYAVKHGARGRGTFGNLAAVAAVLGVVAVVATAVLPGGTLTSKDPDPGRQGRAAERAEPAAAALGGSPEQVLEAYENLPLTFVENRGQTDQRVRYHAQGPGYAFYFTPEEVVLSFVEGADAAEALGRSDASAEARGSVLGTRGSGVPGFSLAAAEDRSTHGVALGLQFLKANPDVVVEGEERAPGEINYLRGNDPGRWQTELPGYTSVVYRELWPNVDMVLHGQDGQLKYEFRVRPGARLADIRLTYAGADGLALDDAGRLLIETPLGVLRDSPPVAYQEIAGERVPVQSRYVLTESGGGKQGYGFAVGPNYRPDQELIIDPGVDYSTFLGGASHEEGNSIAVDAAGNAYVTGTTYSADFPTTLGAFDRTLADSNDVFVSKLNSNGSALIYSTYLGGTPTPVPAGGSDPFEFGRGIAIDAAGNAYVTGQTTSSNFPTTAGAFDRTLNVGTFDATDAFVTKLNAAGSALVYSTFLGGTSRDDGLSIAVDGSGEAYVTGETTSARNFPTTPGAFDTTSNGDADGFVTKLNATGSALVYSTYLGGSDNELAENVAVDTSGNAYVGGSTRSANFPTTSGAFDTTHNGGAFDTLFDAFATKLNAAGSRLVYSTFVGGRDIDFGDGLDIDGAGNVYVSGGTLSSNFPTTAGAFDRSRAGSDAFVAKLNAAGSRLVYSTFLGGGAGEGAVAIAVDGANRPWVTGGTSSANFPTTTGGFDRSLNGPSDVFVTQLNATGTRLIFSTFLGGGRSENGRDIAIDAGGNVYVTGTTFSANFPTTQGAVDRVFSGDPAIFWGDGFVTKLD